MAERTRTRQGRTPEELSGFCAQVAMMLNSGMPLYDGMNALAQAHSGSALEETYAGISNLVTETGSLYEALKSSGGWPRYMTEMTGIAERTGRLEEVMGELAEYYRREAGMRRAIASAVTYPIVLGVMMLLIVLVLITKVLPVFRGVLEGMGLEMTDSGSVMMRLGQNVGWVVLVVVGVLVIATLACCLMLRTGARESVLRALNGLFPPMRRIGRQLSSARVASVLSMLMSSGFPLDEALNMIPSVLDDAAARAQIEELRRKVEQGCALGDAITEAKLFDELHNCMLRTACAAGCSDEAMARIARDYQEKAEDGIANLVSIIEPTLVGALSVVIGAILLSVMLPMAGIISSIL